MARQVCGRIRVLSRLETNTAIIRSSAMLPTPTQKVLYAEVKGTTTAAQLMLT